jgi:hypothetical protein
MYDGIRQDNLCQPMAGMSALSDFVGRHIKSTFPIRDAQSNDRKRP